MDDMFIFYPESLEDGLTEDEVKQALRDYDQRCGKYKPDRQPPEQVVLCQTGTGRARRVILVIIEFEGGQTWSVVLAKAANEMQKREWEECLAARRGSR